MTTSVLFIAGTGRSGSTVLANILGEVDGLFTAGEVRYLWQRGLLEGRLCGCGVPVRQCPVWSRIVTTPGGAGGDREAATMARLLRRTGRLRQVPLMLGGRLWPAVDPANMVASAADREAIGALYARIVGVSGSRVVVDSSKLPAYASLLAQIPEIDLRVVHLVRDPRGAAYSWSSRKSLQDGADRAHMERIGPAKSAVLWDVWNLTAGALLDRGDDRYMRLRYEDLVADPVAALRRILAMVGMTGSDLPFVAAGEVRLGVNHSVAGNPDRLRNGVVRLRADQRWLTAMPERDRRLVSTLTAPILLRYGYSLRAPIAPTVETIFDRASPDESASGRVRRRLRRHLHWGRAEGIGRLIEEDELNPVTRLRISADKWRWRTRNAVAPGAAAPVYLVGLQRSGTNMLARGLDTAPEFEVHNENDRAAFDHFMLRSDDEVRRIVLNSGHRYVLFKPLSDSHRVDRLLDGIVTPSPGRAIWAYREVDGRVRSAVSKFGRNNLFVLRDIAAGRGAQLWQAQRLSDTTLDVVRSFDYENMTAETAAALMWWMRNGLYFEIGLDARDDVRLASYEDLLADPEGAMSSLCDFLDLDYRPALIAHIETRTTRSKPLDIDPRVRTLCDQLQLRLGDALRSQRRGRAA